MADKKDAAHDYSAYEEEERPENEIMAQVDALVREYDSAEREVAELNAKLASANLRLRAIREGRIPEVMDEYGLEELVLKGGIKVKVTESIEVSLPKKEAERYARGLKWLEDHDQGGAVKHQLEVPMGRDSEDKAKALMEDLRKRGFLVKDERWVEPPTLGKVVRELLEQGRKVDEELFGVNRIRRAEIKRPKVRDADD